MTEQEFIEREGWTPDEGDLERANCPLEGTPGHAACGVCEHGRPVFLCPPCFFRRSRGVYGGPNHIPPDDIRDFLLSAKAEGRRLMRRYKGLPPEPAPRIAADAGLKNFSVHRGAPE